MGLFTRRGTVPQELIERLAEKEAEVAYLLEVVADLNYQVAALRMQLAFEKRNGA